MNLCNRWAPCAGLQAFLPRSRLRKLGQRNVRAACCAVSGIGTGHAHRPDELGSPEIQCWFKQPSRHHLLRSTAPPLILAAWRLEISRAACQYVSLDSESKLKVLRSAFLVRQRNGPANGWRNLIHLLGVLQVHLLVVAADDAVADHLGAPALLGHLVGVERFRHADAAIRSVGDFEAGMQAGVSVSTVAETIAGELVQKARGFGCSLIGFLLNRRSEAAVGQLLFRHHRWK